MLNKEKSLEANRLGKLIEYDSKLYENNVHGKPTDNTYGPITYAGHVEPSLYAGRRKKNSKDEMFTLLNLI